MNPLEAKKILKMFVADIDPSQSIAPQLDAKYTLLGNTIVTKKSWQGRFAVFINPTFQRREIERKIHGQFAEALTLRSKKINTHSPEIYKFVKKAIALKLYKPSKAVHEALKATPEIDALEVEFDRVKPKMTRAIYENSLLREAKGNTPLSDQLLDALIFNDELDENLIRAIEIHLERHPHLHADDQKLWISRWREKCERERKYVAALRESSNEERYQFLTQEAANLHERVQALDEKGEESVVYFHHYGTRLTGLEVVLPFLRKCVNIEDFTSLVTLQEIVKCGKIPSPERLAELLIQDIHNTIHETNEIESDLNIPGKELLDIFLPDDERAVPDWLASLLPDLIQYRISHVLKKGVFGNLTSHYLKPTTNQNTVDFLRIVRKFIDEPEKKGWNGLVNDILTHILKKYEKQVTTEIDTVANRFVKKLANQNPGSLFEIAGCDDKLLKGDIWLEFRKQNTGHYALTIYSSGHAQQYHPDAPIFKMENIDADKITPYFFQDLLIRNWGTLWNPENSSKARDFYKGVLEQLGGTVAEASENQNPESAPKTTFDLATHILVPPKSYQGNLQFDMAFESFLDYCRHKYMKDGALDIPEDQYNSFASRLNILLQQFTHVQSNPHYAESRQRIHATLIELNLKLIEIHKIVQKKSNIDFSKFDPNGGGLLKGLGIEPQANTVMYFESIILAVMGEGVDAQMKPTIEGLLENAQTESPAVKVLEQPALLEQTYATLYLNFAWKIARIIMLGSGIYFGGLSSFMTVPGLLTMLPYILSKKNYQLYCETLDAVRSYFIKAFLQICGKYLIPRKIRTATDAIHSKIQNTLQKFQNDEMFPKLNFKIPEDLKPNRPLQSYDSFEYTIFEKLDNGAITLHLTLSPDDSASLLSPNIDPNDIKPFIERAKNTDSLSFKCQIIRTLPLPNPGSIWDNVTDVDETINDLYTLSTMLFIHSEIFGEEKHVAILALYRIQAIMYYLSKSHTLDGTHPIEKGIKPDCTPILKKFLIGSTINDPEVLNDAEILMKHLFPEIDFKTKITLESIDKLGKTLLWNVYIDPIFLTKTLKQQEHIFNRVKKLYLTMPVEEKYFAELIQSPKGFQRLFGIPQNLRQMYLRQESFDIEENDSLIPKRFRFLKLQTLLCSKLVLSQTNYVLPTKTNQTIGTSASDPLVNFNQAQLQNAKLQFESLNINIGFYYDYLKIEYRDPPFDSRQSVFISVIHTDPKWIQGQITFSEQSECVSEYIAYHLSKQPKERLIFDNFYYHFALKNALEKTPNIVKSIVDLIQFYLKKAWDEESEESARKADPELISKLVREAIRLEQFCEYYLPGSKSHFAFIGDCIERMKKQPHIFDSIYLAKKGYTLPSTLELELLRFPTDYRTISDPHLQIKGAALMLKKYFFQGDRKITYQNAVWANLIYKLCSDPNTKQALMYALLDELNLTEDELIYFRKFAHFTVTDFQTTNKAGIFLDIAPNHNAYKPTLNIINYNPTLADSLRHDPQLYSSLNMVDRYTFESNDRENRFIFESLIIAEGINKYTLRWRKLHPNGTYIDYIPTELESRNLSPLVASKLCTGNPYNITAWCSDDYSGRKSHMILTSFDQKRGTLKFKLSGSPSSIRERLYARSDGPKVETNFTLRIPYSSDYLAPLNRFCSTDTITVYGITGNDYPLRIHLKPYDLDFDFEKKSQETPQPYSLLFPGYFIAENQYHPAIATLPFTLLLDSSAGKKKVLIDAERTDFLIISGLSRLDGFSSNLTKLTMDVVVDKPQRASKAKYYVCDIEEKEGDWTLVSSDDKALGMLLIHYLHRLEFTKAESICQRMEWIYHSQKVPESQWPEISYLLVPRVLSSQFGQYRWRIIAAREMNRSIFDDPAPKIEKDVVKSESKIKAPKETSMMILTILDLLNLPVIFDSNKKMTLQQEYNLYKYLLNHLYRLLSNSLPQHQMVRSIMTPDLFEAALTIHPFNEIPQISRYLQLKKTLKIEEPEHLVRLSKTIQFLLSPSDMTLLRLKSAKYQVKKTTNDQPLIQSFISLIKLNGFSQNSADKLQIDCKQFKDEMEPEIAKTLDLNPNRLILSSIKSKFLSFYALMRGSHTFKCESSEGSRRVTKKELKSLLLINKQFGDFTIQRLITILIAVYNGPEAFPETSELLEAHHPKKAGLAGVIDPLIYWNEFLSKLWERVILEEFSRTVVMPILGKHILLQPAKTTVGSFVSTVRSASNPVVAVTSSLALGTLQNETSDILNQVTEKYGTELLSLLTSVDNTDTVKSFATKSIITIAGGAAACVLFNKMGSSAGAAIANAIQNNLPIPNLPLSGRALTAVPFFVGWGYKAGFSLYRKRMIDVVDLIPDTGSQTLSMALNTVVTTGVKAARTYLEMRKQKKAKEEQAAIPVNQVGRNFSGLEEQDKEIDAFLESLFNLVFTEIPSSYDPSDQKDKIAFVPLETSTSPIEYDRRKRINISIADFYNNIDRKKPQYKLTNLEGLNSVYLSLQVFHIALCDVISNEIHKLEDLLNEKYKTIVASLDDHSLTPEDYKSILEIELRPLIQLAASRIQLKQSRAETIKQLLNKAEDLLYCSATENPKKFYELLESLAIGLKMKKNYKLDGENPRLTQLVIQFEAATGFKLWSRQVNSLQISSEGNIVLILKPGDGKTSGVGPVKDAEISDGEHLPVMIFPKQLAGSNMPTVNNQMRRIFNKTSYALEFERNMVLSYQKLESFVALLNGAIISGETVQMTKEDAQSICSLWIENSFQYLNKPSDIRKNNLVLLHKILSTLASKSIAIVDEAHETYAHRKQLNYPLGMPKILKLSYCQTMEIVLREVTHCTELFELLRTNKGYSINLKHYHETYKKDIAAAVSHHNSLNIAGGSPDETVQLKEEFVAYVCDQTPSTPRWISANKKFHQKAALIKGVLNDLLPMNFKNRAGVNYGRHESDQTDFSRPSEGNNGASLNDSIKNPYETYIKTNLMLFVNGLRYEQFTQLVILLKSSVRREMNTTGIPFEGTRVAIRFGKYLTKKLMIDSNYDHYSKDSKAYNGLKNDPAFCMLYARHFIRKQIKYWKLNIENNSHLFATMFHRQISYTGTPYNDGTYPARFKLSPDDGIKGELLHIINQRCPKENIHLIDGNDPESTLNEIIEGFLSKDSKFSAVIDGGALFTGIPNKDVASKIMKYCVTHRKEENILAVKFYMNDDTGKEQLYCFQPNNPTPTLVARLDLDPAKCITYYDQRHGFGADINQEGDGLVTIGPNHALFKWLQEIFRVRALKKENRLQMVEGIEFRQQNIHFVIPKTVHKLISGKEVDPTEPPSLQMIQDYVIENESDLAGNEYFPSMIAKIKHVPVDAIYKKIMSIPSNQFKEWFALFSNHTYLFIQEVPDKPVTLFGSTKRATPPLKALEAASTMTLQTFRNKTNLRSEEIDDIEKALKQLIMPEMLPPLPESVFLPFSDDNIAQFDSIAALGLEQTAQITIEQTADQDVDQEMDQEENINLIQETSNLGEQRIAPHHYDELPWPKLKNPASLTILNFKPNALAENLSLSLKKKYCPLYLFNTILEASDIPFMNFLAPHIDGRIWASNNFIPRTVTTKNELAVEPASLLQRHLAQVLVHFKLDASGNAEILYVGALSLKDGNHWKSQLSSSPLFWEKEEVKVVLWHAVLGHIHAGNDAYEEVLSNSQDFNTLLLQLKILDGQFNFPNEEELLKLWLQNRASLNLVDCFNFIAKSRLTTFNGSLVHKICLESIPGYFIEDEL